MFRDRIAHWTRILDLFPSTSNRVAVLARVSGRSLLAGTYRSKPTVAQTGLDPRRDITIVTAMAYAQSARFNR
jgi:hypothetical protein